MFNYPPIIRGFHAWNGNVGVRIEIFTLLTSFLTPGMEIKGSKWPFLGFF
jgi:hypothetical protein